LLLLGQEFDYYPAKSSTNVLETMKAALRPAMLIRPTSPPLGRGTGGDVLSFDAETRRLYFTVVDQRPIGSWDNPALAAQSLPFP
jgi:hypothetical protein